MMIRLLHIIAIGALISSAVYAYSIKYDTIYLSEQVAKLKSSIRREKETIAVLQAEWQRLNRPERLQVLAERHTDFQPLGIDQIVRFADLPKPQPKIDAIGRKLEDLGLSEPTATPQASDKTTAPSAAVPTSTARTTAASQQPTRVAARVPAASQTTAR